MGRTAKKEKRKSLKSKMIQSKPLILLHLAANHFLDMRRYVKYSSTFDNKKAKEHHQSSLIFHYHKIEKGLSLPATRVGFGRDNAYYLVSLLEEYYVRYSWDDISKVTLNVLYAYYHFNADNDLEMTDLFNRLEALKNKMSSENEITIGGTRYLTKAEIENSNVNFKCLANSRYSIRNFAPGKVSLKLIKESIEIAQKTPSVCNRQTSRVYVYEDEGFKENVLNNQYGNAGFAKDASKILIVTTKIESFIGTQERYQSYIDGGMYAMSLIYALHSLGVGTCALNLSLTNAQEKKMKKAGNISDSEILITMIAVGNIPGKIKVASSHRRDVSEVMTIF